MKEDTPLEHGQWQVEDDDDLLSNPSQRPDIHDVMAARLSRRGFLKASAAAAVGAGLTGTLPGWEPAGANAAAATSLTFKELSHGLDDKLHLSEGYRAQVLMRWGDPVTSDAPQFDPQNQTPASQGGQFGYNCDYIGYIPLDPHGPTASTHGLLIVNHEYSTVQMMFPGSPEPQALTKAQVDTAMLAMGQSIIEVKRGDDRKWSVVADSKYARRITPKTEMVIRGPAAGHPRMRTSFAPNGRRAFGTFGNCAGGTTPWGTIITSEENIQYYFKGDIEKNPEAANYKRMGLGRYGASRSSEWGRVHPRFNLDSEPLSANHSGWMVEIDPLDPKSLPRKRTALGRFKHEGAGVWINPDGRVVVYMGDDQRFEYVYRFVSHARWFPNHRSANRDILDHGTLSVAVFKDDGTVQWMPLVYGKGPLTQENGFTSQADVVIEARRAADLLGATPMDRPEDVEVNPVTGTVFVMLTKNKKRTEVNAPNPRTKNTYGQIVEMVAPNGDHGAETFKWSFLLMAGDPKDPKHGARFHPDTTDNGWFMAPDNCTFDNKGRLWIATDGSERFGFADGLWACDVVGPGRALTRHFMRTPKGAELTGPCFTPDNTTLFCSIQHPAEGSSFDKPDHRWPDFDPALPPRPSIVAIDTTALLKDDK